MLQELRNAILPPRRIVQVITINGDGTVTVVSDSGFEFNAIGTASVNDYVYVQDGLVLGTAANLPHGDIDI